MMLRSPRCASYFTAFTKKGRLPPEVIGRNANLRRGERWIPGIGYVAPNANELVSGELRHVPGLASPSDERVSSVALQSLGDAAMEHDDFAQAGTKADGPPERRAPIAADIVPPTSDASPTNLDPIFFGAVAPDPAVPVLVPSPDDDTGISAIASSSGLTRAAVLQRRRDEQRQRDRSDPPPPAAPSVVLEAETSSRSSVVEPSLPSAPREARQPSSSARPRSPALEMVLDAYWRKTFSDAKRNLTPKRDRDPDCVDQVKRDGGPARDAVIIDWFDQRQKAGEKFRPGRVEAAVAARCGRQQWRDGLAILDVVLSRDHAPTPTTPSLRDDGSAASVPTAAVVVDPAELLMDDLTLTDAPSAPSEASKATQQRDTAAAVPLTHEIVLSSETRVAAILSVHVLLRFARQHASVPLAMLVAATASEGGLPLTLREYNAVLAVCAAAADAPTASRVLAQLMDAAIVATPEGRLGSVAADEVAPGSKLMPNARSFRHCVVAAAHAGNWRHALGYLDLAFGALASPAASGNAPDPLEAAAVVESIEVAACVAVEGGAAAVGLGLALAVAANGNAAVAETVNAADARSREVAKRMCHVLRTIPATKLNGVQPNAATFRAAYRGMVAANGHSAFDAQLQLFRWVSTRFDAALTTQPSLSTSWRLLHALEDGMLVLNGIAEAGGGGATEDGSCAAATAHIWSDALSLLSRCGQRVPAAMLQSAMHHANEAGEWRAAAAAYEHFIGSIADPERSALDEGEADPTSDAVLAFGLARGDLQLLPSEQAEQDWWAMMQRTAMPPEKSRHHLELDACLHQYLRAATLSLANPGDWARAPQSNPLVDNIVASFSFSSWRTATLPTYLALLQEAGKHAQVIAAYHAVADHLRRRADRVLAAVLERHGDSNTDADSESPGRPSQRSPKPPMAGVGAKSLRGGMIHEEGRGVGERDTLPTVAMSPEALAIVTESCAATGMWRLGLQAVEWMANGVNLPRDVAGAPGGDSVGDDEERQALLRSVITEVKALCIAHSYTPEKWRVPHEVP